MNDDILAKDGELYHYGVKGMKWGVRRYQNADGSLTAAGKKRQARDFNTLKKSAQKALDADAQMRTEIIDTGTVSRRCTLKAHKHKRNVDKLIDKLSKKYGSASMVTGKETGKYYSDILLGNMSERLYAHNKNAHKIVPAGPNSNFGYIEKGGAKRIKGKPVFDYEGVTYHATGDVAHLPIWDKSGPTGRYAASHEVDCPIDVWNAMDDNKIKWHKIL